MARRAGVGAKPPVPLRAEYDNTSFEFLTSVIILCVLLPVCGIFVSMNGPFLPPPPPVSVNAVLLTGGYFFDELIRQIDLSQQSIFSIQYQWKWNIHQRNSCVQRLGSTIARARSRNVEVNVLLHQEAPDRHLTVINRVTNDQLTRLGCHVKMYSPSQLLHAKVWIIDNERVFIGSHNVSSRSLTTNEECSVFITSVEFSRSVRSYFDLLWG